MRRRNTRIQKQKFHSVMPLAVAAGGVGAVLALAAAILTGQTSTIVVSAGEDLQDALNRAEPGDVVRLEAGATFTGSFQLPAKSGTAPITVRSSTDDRSLPGASQRIGPGHAKLMATIRASGDGPALRTAAGASHWRIVAVRIQGTGGSDLVLLGDGSSAQHTYDAVPQDLVLDRVLVQGDPSRGQKRGIALNSGDTTIKNSYISDIKAAGQETQAIAGWNGPGPYLIENNYIEAAGINVLFGGAGPSIGSLVPSDITVRRNQFTKNLDWRNTSWTVKNLFELKNARRVLIEGNTFENNWSAAQAGYAILFTVRNQGNVAPWSTVEHVTFQNNRVKGVAAAINVLGYDTEARSDQARGILIRNNLFDEVDHRKWGGNGTFLQLGDEPADVVVERNTILQSGNVITVYGGSTTSPRQIHGLRFVKNIAFHNSFGIFGNAAGTGNSAIARYFPDAEIVGNVLAGGQSRQYPAGNFFPTVAELTAHFVNYQAGDYRLTQVRTLRGDDRDDADLGVDFTELNRALGAVGGAVPRLR